MRIGIALAAAALIPACLAAASPAPAPDAACEFQNDSCTTPAPERPVSAFRMGFSVLQEANAGSVFDLYPRRMRRHGLAADFTTNLGAEFSYAFRRLPRMRFALLFAPLSVDWRTRWPDGKDAAHLYLHGTAFLEAQYRGVCLTFGSSEYKLGGAFRQGFSNWDNTSIGIGLVVARLPGWGGKVWIPEWR